MTQAMQTVATAAAPPAGMAGSATNEFLIITLGKEEYGIEILKVQEIRSYDAVTRIDNATEFLKGVINLRGTVVPVVDMRIKLNLSNAEYNQFTVMIILKLTGRVVAIVADSATDVIILTPEQIRPAPDFSSNFNAKYILGLGAVDQRMLILLNIEQLMTGNGMALVSSVSAAELELS